jgi:hypothetical protein
VGLATATTTAIFGESPEKVVGGFCSVVFGFRAGLWLKEGVGLFCVFN